MLDALCIATICDRNTIEVRSSRVGSHERTFLRALLSQFDGDVDGAIRILRRLIARGNAIERAVSAEVLAPMLIMRHDFSAVEALAKAIDGVGWLASAEALRAVASADVGNFADSRFHISRATTALSDDVDVDDVSRLRIIQRLARALFAVGDYEEALHFAASGATIAKSLNAWRAAAACYSVAHTIHHTVTGLHDEARRFASYWYEAARRADDSSFVFPALVAEYELAVQFADDDRIAQLESQMHKPLLPQQYAERFYYASSFAIVRGARDPVAMRTLIEVLRGSPGLSRGQSSLCHALVALADASMSDDDNARINIRSAIAALERPSSRDPAHERFNRKLARGSIAAACVLIGDDVRADRILAVAEVRGDVGVRNIARLTRERRWADFDKSLAGIARVYETSWSRRSNERPAGTLTSAEIAVLKLFERGWNAGRIAEATDRSVNTVYNHSRSIFGKLEVNNVLQAVAIARDRGIIA